jgi:hypothetical protein
VNPETVMMLLDFADQLGRVVLFLILLLAGIGAAGLFVTFVIGIAIRRTIRYLWRRMAEGSL